MECRLRVALSEISHENKKRNGQSDSSRTFFYWVISFKRFADGVMRCSLWWSEEQNAAKRAGDVIRVVFAASQIPHPIVRINGYWMKSFDMRCHVIAITRRAQWKRNQHVLPPTINNNRGTALSHVKVLWMKESFRMLSPSSWMFNEATHSTRATSPGINSTNNKH